MQSKHWATLIPSRTNWNLNPNLNLIPNPNPSTNQAGAALNCNTGDVTSDVIIIYNVWYVDFATRN